LANAFSHGFHPQHVERLAANWAEALGPINGEYKGLSSFRAALNGDPKYVPKSPDQSVEDFRRYVGQMQPRLPELFGVLPKTPLTVEAAPASQPNNPTHYIFGTSDGTRPARVVVAASNYAAAKTAERRDAGLP